MIAIGVIGYGYWGPNLARNFAELPDVRVAAVSDLRAERLRHVAARHPGVEITTDVQAILADPGVDAVVLATPVSTHFDLGMRALRAGKHVLVAKPLADTLQHAEQLVDEAARRRLVLLVDHTFVYSGAVRKIRELLGAGQLGQLYYYDSVRVNLGLFRHDVNVLWDLAAHDLSIMDYVLPFKPNAVSGTAVAHVPGRVESLAYLTCFFDDRFIAHFHVNWLAPVKIRRTMIAGAAQMIVYDDLEPSEKIKVYDKGVPPDDGDERRYQFLVDYRIGDMWAPQLDTTEPLRIEARHFVGCIDAGLAPITDGAAGVRVVRLLAAASASLKVGGRRIDPHTLRPCE
jgi:predicted dehydrogenase